MESNKRADELKVQIYDHLYDLDTKTGPELFVTSWNATTADPTMKITAEEGRITDCIFKWKYFWCLSPMMAACRHVLAEQIRTRFEVPAKSKPYVPDEVQRLMHVHGACTVYACMCMYALFMQCNTIYVYGLFMHVYVGGREAHVLPCWGSVESSF